MKRVLPYAITVVCVAIVMASLFLDLPGAKTAQKELDKWSVLSTSVACAVGLVSLTSVHLRRVQRRSEDWGFSVYLLAITFGYMVFGLFVGPANAAYSWIFNATAAPLGVTFYALLAFYIVSAAYRAFRAKTRDAAILLAAAIIVLFGKAPLGEVILPAFGTWTKWIMDIPNTAAMRAVAFGASLGGVISGIRILLGFDRPYVSGE